MILKIENYVKVDVFNLILEIWQSEKGRYDIAIDYTNSRFNTFIVKEMWYSIPNHLSSYSNKLYILRVYSRKIHIWAVQITRTFIIPLLLETELYFDARIDSRIVVCRDYFNGNARCPPPLPLFKEKIK